MYLLLLLVLQFSVLRYESVIHEFDPWFNYRSTIKVQHPAASRQYDHAHYLTVATSSA
jgi:hypothetical protein